MTPARPRVADDPDRLYTAGFTLLSTFTLPPDTVLPPGYTRAMPGRFTKEQSQLLAAGALFRDDVWGTASSKWKMVCTIPVTYADWNGVERSASLAFALIRSPLLQIPEAEADAALAHLLRAGRLDPDARDADGVPLLIRCGEHDRDVMAHHLLAAGADPELYADVEWMPGRTDRCRAHELALWMDNDATATVLNAFRARQAMDTVLAHARTAPTAAA